MKHRQELSSCNTIIIDNATLDKTLRKFWEAEEVTVNAPPPLPEHQICEALFKNTTVKLQDSHYRVRIPFKPDRKPLNESICIAVKRLHAMEKRFTINTDLRKLYVEFMEEYLRLGHMKEIEPPKCTSDYLYLPHHGVWRESSTTTKLRVVFDASAKTTSGYSLNDNLLTGPSLQPLLGDILIRFRKNKIAFTADAEKMFRQIWIHPDDLRYQRIVWRKSPDSVIKHFELQTLTYGMSSAPYLATRVVQHVAEANLNQYPEASRALLNNMYVDDLLTGTQSVEEAVNLAEQISNIMNQSGFKLRKWSSNSADFLRKLKIAESNPTIPRKLSEDSDEIKVLGLQWQPSTDHFTYHVQLRDIIPSSKRTILSEASQIFDPLGLISPFVIKLKCFFQALWLHELGWDDSLPTAVQEQWLEIRREIDHVSNITIPRWLRMTEKDYQLHGFCDSSEKAFAATLYLRTQYDGCFVVNLIAAKTKVAPIRNISLPRLELNGALLLIRLMKRVQQIMNIPEQLMYGWTDSTIVLDWLAEPPRKWQTYVANRTSEILEVLPRRKWRHISSKLNPADCATRGLSPMELKHYKLWWNGPDFLQESEEHWPILRKARPTSELERRKILIVRTVNHDHASNSNSLIEELLTTYSEYDKIVHILTIIQKFISMCRKVQTRTTSLSSSEWRAAEVEILRYSQAKCFSDEIKDIRRNSVVSQGSVIKALHPFIDKQGLLRVGGRIERAIAQYDTIHPIILSSKSIAATLLIRKYHKTNMHCGAGLLMSLIRRRFWITKARDLIKSVVRRCVYCIKQRPKMESQVMGILPKERVQLIRPFLKIGLDFAGPIRMYLRRGRGQRPQKAYICCIVCLSTKAIHLELVGDLTTQSFLGALNRLFSRRGVSTDIFSDNGSNFRGASRQLSELNIFIKNNIKFLSHSMLRSYQINWHFIPPSAPHFGGIWEAGVKSAKTHMERVIGNQVLTQEELHTLLVQIEGVLNSRPLCSLSDDEIDPLTPAHFLIGHSITSIPQADITEVPFNRLDHWNAIQKMVQLFWKRWHLEYLTSLQARTKWNQTKENLQIGNIVLIKEENPLVNQWKMGRIIQLFPGMDKQVRVADIQTNQGVLRRPITKLCRLPVN